MSPPRSSSRSTTTAPGCCPATARSCSPSRPASPVLVRPGHQLDPIMELCAETASAHVRSCEGFRMPACRDVAACAGAGVRKPPGKEPAGVGRAVCHLWGFEWPAAFREGRAGRLVGGGSTIDAEGSSALLPSTGRFRHDRRACAGRSDGAGATSKRAPAARSSGGRAMR